MATHHSNQICRSSSHCGEKAYKVCPQLDKNDIITYCIINHGSRSVILCTLQSLIIQCSRTLAPQITEMKTIKFISYYQVETGKFSCHVEITGKPVNLGLSKGMQVPFQLLFKGRKSFTDLLNTYCFLLLPFFL